MFTEFCVSVNSLTSILYRVFRTFYETLVLSGILISLNHFKSLKSLFFVGREFLLLPGVFSIEVP